MIKTTHAALVSIIPMLILTWYFSGMMDEYYEERMRLQERVWTLEDDCGFQHKEKWSNFNATLEKNPFYNREYEVEASAKLISSFF